jgi:isopentenyl diphosphate isomerase/L-lactate dehydrogenase-like FMN-dependent dehydrogenase
MSVRTFTRREALQAATATKAPVKLAPCDELLNAFEFEEQARLALPPNLFQTIAGGDRDPFNRITFRPRMNNPVLDMDLTVEVLGQPLFTPIVVGPISDQGRFHKEGEIATIHGAEAAKALVVVSSRSTVPIEQIAAQAKSPFWYSVYLEPDGPRQAHAAVAAGASAVFVTVGAISQSSNDNGRSAKANREIDWGAVDLIRKGLNAPLAIKGITTPDEAKAALQHDVQGMVISNFGGLLGPGKVTPMDALTSIVDVVAGKVPVLIDGGFRRGTCVLKALALGADAVLIGRPVAWGLSAYGSQGVQAVLELIQNEFARSIAMLGVSRPKQLTRDYVRLHKRATT